MTRLSSVSPNRSEYELSGAGPGSSGEGSRQHRAGGVRGALGGPRWPERVQCVGEDLDADRGRAVGQRAAQRDEIEVTLAGEVPVVQRGGDEVGFRVSRTVVQLNAQYALGWHGG